MLEKFTKVFFSRGPPGEYFENFQFFYDGSTVKHFERKLRPAKFQNKSQRVHREPGRVVELSEFAFALLGEHGHPSPQNPKILF